MEAVAYYDMVKVWPLRAGITGLTAAGKPCPLMPGIAGWMRADLVASAEASGHVQAMTGLRPQDLREPELNDRGEPRRKRRRGYARRDFQAQPANEPPVPFIGSDDG